MNIALLPVLNPSTERGQTEPKEQKSWGHHVGKNAHVWISMLREDVQGKEQQKSEETANGYDRTGKTNPVAKQAPNGATFGGSGIHRKRSGSSPAVGNEGGQPDRCAEGGKLLLEGADMSDQGGDFFRGEFILERLHLDLAVLANAFGDSLGGFLIG